MKTCPLNLNLPCPLLSNDQLDYFLASLRFKYQSFYTRSEWSGVYWKLETSGTREKSGIVFYYFPTSFTVEFTQKFFERWRQSNDLVITNCSLDVPSEFAEKDFIFFNDDVSYFYLMKKILDYFYPTHWKDKKIVGVTGTNGKTTTCYLAQQLARQWGQRAFYLGTLGVCDNQNIFYKDNSSDLTTPHPIDLHKIFYSFFKGHDVLFMEVSSHALHQDRVRWIEFDQAAFLNFTQDHLDYHRDMESYFQEKIKIIKKLRPSSKLWILEEQVDLWNKVRCEKKQKIKQLKENEGAIFFSTAPFFLRIDYNYSNYRVALALNKALWKKEIKIDLSKMFAPPGRFESIKLSSDQEVVIDSAHTPDALQNIIYAIRKSRPQIFLSVLFGCGGNRDAKKRPIMGQIVSSLANACYITADNPRTEDLSKILQEIFSGVEITKRNEVHLIEDREQAILKALAELPSPGILLLAGKGHENYQIIGTQKNPFEEKSIVESFLHSRSIQGQKN